MWCDFQFKFKIVDPAHSQQGLMFDTLYPGITLGLGSANQRIHHMVMTPLTGWVYYQNDPWYPITHGTSSKYTGQVTPIVS